MAWKIDPVHSHVGFTVKHLMVSTVRGEFKTYTGTLDIDPADFTRSAIAGDIEVASLDTREPARDEHLRSADFFDAATHPALDFRSTRIEHVGGSEYRVHGDLTIRGTTRPIVLETEFNGVQTDPWGGKRLGLVATGTIVRQDFGLVWNVALEAGGFLVGDKVKLDLSLEAVQAEVPELAGTAS